MCGRAGNLLRKCKRTVFPAGSRYHAPREMTAGHLQKLLVIDDDRKLCRLLHDYLGPLGYEVSAEHTGPEGLEAAKEGGFDVVLLDLMLPGMEGTEVLRELRRVSDVPV